MQTNFSAQNLALRFWSQTERPQPRSQSPSESRPDAELDSFQPSDPPTTDGLEPGYSRAS